MNDDLSPIDMTSPEDNKIGIQILRLWLERIYLAADEAAGWNWQTSKARCRKAMMYVYRYPSMDTEIMRCLNESNTAKEWHIKFTTLIAQRDIAKKCMDLAIMGNKNGSAPAIFSLNSLLEKIDGFAKEGFDPLSHASVLKPMNDLANDLLRIYQKTGRPAYSSFGFQEKLNNLTSETEDFFDALFMGDVDVWWRAKQQKAV